MFVVLNELVETVEVLEQMEHVDMVETVETVRIDDKLFMHTCTEHQKQYV